MEIKSPVFINNEEIPFKYSCDGQNISPPLSFKDIPQNAKSLALTVEDPDAPRGLFVHWIVWNINPKTEGFKEGSVPDEAFQGVSGAGKAGYIGPCPPSGTHRYFFKLYALNRVLDLEKDSNMEAFQKAINDCVIGKAELMGLYSR